VPQLISKMITSPLLLNRCLLFVGYI